MHSSQPDPTTGDNETRSGNDVVRTGRLEGLARQLAERQTLSDHPPRNAPILVRLEELEDLLHNAYRHFSQASEDGLSLSHAGEWLLDNFYLTQRAIRQIRVDMPKGFYRQLPKLDKPPLEGYPRIYDLVQEMIRYCECRLDLGIVMRFVQAYQRVTSLTMGELWALPTMLRIVTLENLVEALASIAGLHVRSFEEISMTMARTISLADEEIIAHSITSLRTMAVHDWKVFFESVSQVNGVLCRDPANIYACMDFETRDRYRKVVEELARATDFDEKEVSREAIGLARNATGRQKSSRLNHVGYYLVDAGRAQLESRLGFQPPLILRLRRWLFAHSSLVYFGGINLLTLIILLGFLRYTLVAGGNLLQLIGATFIVLTPGVTVAINLVNWLITYTIPPRVLPKMEYQEGIPAEYRTVVVVPALLSHPGDVESVLQQMELHYLGNADPHIHFALLTDFVDAPQKDMPGDRSLLELAKGGVQTLNQKYGQQNAGPFYLFHRQRQWNPSENCWMGWERKRGKLAEFNRFILNKSNELDQIPSKGERGNVSFNPQVGNLDILSEVKYIITLDADTSLPPGSANRLIATLAHPLNRAEFNPESDEVVAGYTVLQPRMEIRPESANQSMFTRIYAGDIGLDLYTRAVSDV
ncbi:MAG: hypothetical protein KAS19_07535, partial [Anaerolineales bacterium]|nr:hypothetical protein [Anaerolineales bacterium]